MAEMKKDPVAKIKAMLKLKFSLNLMVAKADQKAKALGFV